MKRREFLTTAAGASLAASALDLNAAETDARDPLPRNQNRPDPDLGSHWSTFKKLSADCRAEFSYLNDKFSKPEEWTAKARSILAEGFHYQPAECDAAAELVERVDVGTHYRERVMISTTPNIRIPVYVLVPKKLEGPAPALVALHDHGGFYFWGKEKVVHVPPENPELVKFKETAYGGRSIADELAKRGYVVIAPDMLHWGERAMYFEEDPDRIKNRTLEVTREDVLEFNARSWAHEELVSRTALTCGATWSGIIAWDDMRVTDYLLSRPEVDADRVGCLGLSVGSVRTIFLGAMHSKVRASVAVCWMAEYQPMVRNNVRNGIGFTKLVPGLYGQLDWPDLAGLHWPGALMTINGLQDRLYPLEAAQGAVEKIEKIFAKMDAADNYEGVFFDGPHEFNVQMQEKAFAWLGHQLS